MCIRKSLLAVVGAVVMGVVIGASAYAMTDNTNYLTFSAPVALPGITLPAGTYVFRMPSDDRNVVQVMNRTATRSYYMGLTQPIQRPQRGTALLVTVGEAPAGQAPPIRAWFPVGQLQGHSFNYAR
jgi:hypothetical protein